MSNNQISDELRAKFPELQPINSPPKLYTINGIGCTVYGKRDADAQTGTYIKTHVFCVAFIPVIALGAYRVAPASSRSWYFLGREPLSMVAKLWNGIVASMVLVLALNIGIHAYTDSPIYRAGQELKTADRDLKEGKVVEALTIYRSLAGGSFYPAESREGLYQCLEKCLKSDKAVEAQRGLEVLAKIPKHLNQPVPLVPDGFKRGLALVEKFRAENPETGLAILRAAAPLDATQTNVVKTLEIELLKQTIAAKPNNTNRIVELALIFEKDRQMDQAAEVLVPHREILGQTEGARVLGQHWLREGKYEDAYQMLNPYVESRLSELPKIESAYTNMVSSISHRAIQDLEKGKAGHEFYTQYKNSSKADQQRMVDDYIQGQMEADPGYQRVLGNLKQANRIVPVALDLGIVQLNRARELKDAGARTAELKAAEKTFLAIRGFAGDTDEYRLFMGQVSYWLGKSKEGKQLFDELLAAKKREYKILMAVSQTLREVGEVPDARTFTEEAYQVGKTPKEQHAAAALRALCQKDIDDQITWLGKADPEDLWTQIELNGARGKRSLQLGEKVAAAGYLRQAISGYESLTKTSSSLNNCGLACLELYSATGNPDDQKRGLTMLEEALTLAPGDSILLENTAFVLFGRAVMDVVGDSIHFDITGERPSLAMVAMLYANETEREVIYQKLRGNEAMKKALVYFDKALLLAPKNAELYSATQDIYAAFHDKAELQRIRERMRVASPNISESSKETVDFYSGAKDAETRARIEGKIRNFEKLLQAPAVKTHVPTLAFVEVGLVREWEEIQVVGVNPDIGRLVRTAENAYSSHVSSSTRQALISALYVRASEALAKKNPQFAGLLQKTRHLMTPRLLITLLSERGGTLAGDITACEDVRKAVALEEESVKSFPGWVQPSEWAAVKKSNPQLAASLAVKLKQNETLLLANELEKELSPLNATAILQQYWTRRALGDESGAVALYKTAQQSGVPLPELN